MSAIPRPIISTGAYTASNAAVNVWPHSFDHPQRLGSAHRCYTYGCQILSTSDIYWKDADLLILLLLLFERSGI